MDTDQNTRYQPSDVWVHHVSWEHTGHAKHRPPCTEFCTHYHTTEITVDRYCDWCRPDDNT